MKLGLAIVIPYTIYVLLDYYKKKEVTCLPNYKFNRHL